MKTKGFKTLTTITAVAIFFCLLNAVWVCVQSYNLYTAENNFLTFDKEPRFIYSAIFYSRVIFSPLYNALLITFLVKQLVAIKKGTLFPRTNIRIIFLIAVCYFIGSFATDNHALLHFENNPLMINDGTIIYTLLFIIFGIIYKVAVDVAEENNLTV